MICNMMYLGYLVNFTKVKFWPWPFEVKKKHIFQTTSARETWWCHRIANSLSLLVQKFLVKKWLLPAKNLTWPLVTLTLTWAKNHWNNFDQNPNKELKAFYCTSLFPSVFKIDRGGGVKSPPSPHGTACQARRLATVQVKKSKICHPQSHTDTRQRSVYVWCVMLWTSLPDQLVAKTRAGCSAN